MVSPQEEKQSKLKLCEKLSGASFKDESVIKFADIFAWLSFGLAIVSMILMSLSPENTSSAQFGFGMLSAVVATIGSFSLIIKAFNLGGDFSEAKNRCRRLGWGLGIQIGFYMACLVVALLLNSFVFGKS